MRCTGTDKTTEQEFMDALWNRKSECCGPLIRFAFRPSVLMDMSLALDTCNASGILESADSGEGYHEFCVAHWYDLSLLIGGVAEAHDSDQWKSLKRNIFIMASRGAGWDHREMFNRFASFYRAKTGGYDSLGAM